MSQLYKHTHIRFLLMYSLIFLGLQGLVSQSEDSVTHSKKINLALRRTADGLLRLAKDSTSRIPAIKQINTSDWQIELPKSFTYDHLPPLLQESLDQYGIKESYDVTIRRCNDNIIDLGYQKKDLPKTDGDTSSNVPCSGRMMEEGCYYIEISFFHSEDKNTLAVNKSWLLLFIFPIIGGIWLLKTSFQKKPLIKNTEETVGINIGNTILYADDQVIQCVGKRETLTFRETKLLHLFATNLNKLLERDFILQQVWADEGVLVGRSVDVFVSRLRKKIAADSSLSIVVVHGVGYRLECSQSNGM